MDLRWNPETVCGHHLTLCASQRVSAESRLDRLGTERAGKLTQPVGDDIGKRGRILAHVGLIRCDIAAARIRSDPETHELADFLFESHLLDEGVCPLLCGERMVVPARYRCRLRLCVAELCRHGVCYFQTFVDRVKIPVRPRRLAATSAVRGGCLAGDQPLTDPSITPDTKYRCTNGYTQRMGITMRIIVTD